MCLGPNREHSGLIYMPKALCEGFVTITDFNVPLTDILQSTNYNPAWIPSILQAPLTAPAHTGTLRETFTSDSYYNHDVFWKSVVLVV